MNLNQIVPDTFKCLTPMALNLLDLSEVYQDKIRRVM